MSILTRELAREQAARLQSIPMVAPQSKEGRTEVVDCLLRNCVSLEHCTETLTGVLDTALTIKNLTASIAFVAAKSRPAELPPPGCDKCALGEHPITGEMRWSAHVAVDVPGRLYTSAQRCTCERGSWLEKKHQTAKAIAANQAKLEAPRYRNEELTGTKNFKPKDVEP